MWHQLITRSRHHGVMCHTMNSTTELVIGSTLTAPVLLLMASQTLTLETLKDSAWVCSPMLTVTRPSRALEGTLGKVYTCITLEAKFTLNALVTRPSLFRVEIATTVMASTQQQCVRFPQDALLKFSTIKNLLSCFHNPLIMISRQCTSWLRCVQFVWVLSKAGVQSIIVKMWPVLLVGLKFTSLAPFSGWIRCFTRWPCQKMGPPPTRHKVGLFINEC